MFKKEYVFYGSHANKVKNLTSNFSEKLGVSLFERNVDVLIFGAMIGCIYRTVDKVESDSISKGGITTKIFTDTMIKESDKIEYIYENIMLVHDKDNLDIDTRLDRAFRYNSKSEEFKQNCKDIFNSYVLGGINILYEKLNYEATDIDDYLRNFYEFLEQFNEKYYLADTDIDIREYY